MITGKKIKMKVKKSKEDKERDRNRAELLNFLNSSMWRRSHYVSCFIFCVKTEAPLHFIITNGTRSRSPETGFTYLCGYILYFVYSFHWTLWASAVSMAPRGSSLEVSLVYHPYRRGSSKSEAAVVFNDRAVIQIFFFFYWFCNVFPLCGSCGIALLTGLV